MQLFYQAGLLPDGENFYPEKPITRAEFTDLLVTLARAADERPSAEETGEIPNTEEICELPLAGETGEMPNSGEPGEETTKAPAEEPETFSDVPTSYWAFESIRTARDAGWIDGYEDGSFHPDEALSRAETCYLLNRCLHRSGDAERAAWLSELGLFDDVPSDHWAAVQIAEACVRHTYTTGAEGKEIWGVADVCALHITGKPGFREIGERLVYFDRKGALAVDRTIGAFRADAYGALTQTASFYVYEPVPYLSQVDNGVEAYVGCEPVAALTGLKAKGFASGVAIRDFLDHMPYAETNPELGFVGTPYQHTDEVLRTTIYPAKLAEYLRGFSRRKPGGAAAGTPRRQPRGRLRDALVEQAHLQGVCHRRRDGNAGQQQSRGPRLRVRPGKRLPGLGSLQP